MAAERAKTEGVKYKYCNTLSEKAKAEACKSNYSANIG